ncbi:MAG: hypothetical protein K2G85_07505 [Muribaculaceae bacterium]|nr:hypothetical protein [Muribaculaceae bacterium]
MSKRFENYKNRASFKLPQNFEGIVKHAQADDDLLICLRSDCLHIYYRGGKILEAKNRLSFDKKYLDLKKSHLPSELVWLSSFKDADVIEDPKKYFMHAKKAMDLWFQENPKQERDDQQSIALHNQSCLNEGELAVIDIEYAVSFNSNCYNKVYKDTFKEYVRYPNPRFDIIAIDREGQIYVFELKTGLGSTKNCVAHITDFAAMIGSHRIGDNDSMAVPQERWLTFASEMNEVVAKLNDKRYRDCKSLLPSVKMDRPPVFMFAFTDNKDVTDGKNDSSMIQREKFEKIVSKAISDAVKISEKRALGKDVEDLINNNFIRKEIMYIDDNSFKLKL